ncbi:MAG: ATP-dependent zinc metalloprotease FtsH [Anaerolineae bacterium]
MDTDDKGPQRVRTSGSWVLLLVLLVAFYAWMFWPRDASGGAIPYSSFLEQVRQGNVASVQIRGDSITGDLRSAVPPSTLRPGQAAPGDAPISSFSTTYPEAVGDPQLVPLLEEHNVVIDVAPPASAGWLAILLPLLLPMIFLGLLLFWMRRATTQNQDGLMGFGRSRARRHVGLRSDTTFDDVAGADESKADLQEIVDFLKNPAKYHQIGARIPRGVLLVGPPGTGKTLMARAVSGEANVPFFNINATEFVEMFVGVGASRVRDLFGEAKKVSPAIVFIDELDAVGRRRGAGVGNVNDEREQTLNQLLVEMDGFDARHEVIVMAATNRPDVLDPALLRPGRFDRQITVALPDRKGREDILKIHTQHLSLARDVELGELARSTTGFSGADLANLANEAALVAARLGHHQVTRSDLDVALDKIILGGERPLILSTQDRRVVAYHEAGHALVAWLTPGADAVRKVTIIPHGRALGVTQQLPGEDQYNYSRTYLEARLGVMLGGRAAEEIIIEDITIGAENDLTEATRLARRMVSEWGMGDLGLAAFETSDGQPFLGYELAQGRIYSDETASRIDRNVQSLLDHRYRHVYNLLQQSRVKLETLAEALLEEETVTRERMVELLGPRAEPASDIPVTLGHPEGIIVSGTATEQEEEGEGEVRGRPERQVQPY